MKKSLLLVFAVIAATSAFRLPLNLKTSDIGIGKVEYIRQKDALVKNKAMTDVILVIPYGSNAMAIGIPEDSYESEAMPNIIPKLAHKIDVMDAAVRQALLQSVLESFRQQDEESERIADTLPKVSKGEYEAYNNLDYSAYKSKDMIDESYEFENQAMEEESEDGADEELFKSLYENIFRKASEPRKFSADAGFDRFKSKGFNIDGVDVDNLIADEGYTAHIRSGADRKFDLYKQSHADSNEVEPLRFLTRLFTSRK